MKMNFRTVLSWALAITIVSYAYPQDAQAQNKILRLRFDGPVLESPNEDAQMFSLVLGGSESRTLYQWVQLIERATEDPEIAGLAVIIEQPQMGLAQIEEISKAFKDFRAAGKKIYCYMDYAGNGSYALACATDYIMLAEYSDLGIVGLNAEASYYKGLLDKIGVKADLVHCGAYKSALEPYTRTEPSPEAADNINWLLNGIFDFWIGAIAEGRDLTPLQVKMLVDQAPLDADLARESKLIDAVGSFEDFRRLIRKEYGQDVEIVKKLDEEGAIELDFENPFAIFQVFSDIIDKQREPAEPGIALIYIDGGIVVGKNDANPFGGGGTAGSTTIRAAFQKALENDSIKAIVVRVNSPGGSALASDIMWKIATRCAEVKPLIVSQGNVAASGGYYVSIPGDVIFSDEATVTASIGVVGGKFVWKELMEEKLGITTTQFKRGEHAGLMSMERCWTESERAYILRMMTDVYDQFKGRIMTSRGDRLKKELESMAAGRVFTGKQALELGLVDRIGGLSDAVEYAAEKAGLEEYEVYAFPKAEDLADILARLMNEDTEDEWEIEYGAGAAREPMLKTVLPMLSKFAPIKARGIAQMFHTMMTLQDERVGCYMPFEIEIR